MGTQNESTNDNTDAPAGTDSSPPTTKAKAKKRRKKKVKATKLKRKPETALVPRKPRDLTNVGAWIEWAARDASYRKSCSAMALAITVAVLGPALAAYAAAPVAAYSILTFVWLATARLDESNG